jgi:hypothetical protein
MGKFGCLILATSLLGSSLLRPSPAGAEELRLIYDTDICGDVDDVLALGIIHSLQSRGGCRLLAVTVSVDNDQAAPFVDAVNTFYGRGDIPIGMVRKGGVVEQSKYLGLVNEKDEQGRDRYPHDLRSGRDAPGAVALLRKTLAAQPDGSVVIVQVGFSTNLADLLASAGDESSPLSGKDLVARKVRFLSAMAASFRPINGKMDYAEYNVVRDVPSFHRLASDWPTRIVFSGFEIGITVFYPFASIERDFGYVRHHPVAEAYRLYNPTGRDQATFDLTSVVFAVLPDRGYFDLSKAGTVTVKTSADGGDPRPDGATRFREHPGGKHEYLILSPEQAIRLREALVMLTSQPPTRPVEARR